MPELEKPGNTSITYDNKATKTITTVLGITLALGGLHHGFYETLQGSTPTGGLFIQAIGEAHRMWVHGAEEAFTILPNFLITGIAAMSVSIIIMLWSIFFIGKSCGRTVFLLLFLVLTLFGGGIGHIAFFLPVWGYATRINKPLRWWKKVLPQQVRKVISKYWLYTLVIALASFIIALVISGFGIFPGVTNPDTKLIICWSFLLLSLIFINITYISGFAYDIERSQDLKRS